ncbi:MAG: porin [Planctomycetota bacterium]
MGIRIPVAMLLPLLSTTSLAGSIQVDEETPIAEFGADFHFRYLANFNADQTGSDDDSAIGFTNARTRLKASGTIPGTDVEFDLVGQFRDGDFRFELVDAAFTKDFTDNFRLRIGQFRYGFSREFQVSRTRQLAIERSVVHSVFRFDRTQGVEGRFRGERDQLFVGITDGRRAVNSDFTSSREADIAVNTRYERRMGDAGWGAYRDLTSYRGADTGALFGAGLYYQQDGRLSDAGLSGTVDAIGYTADVSFEGDGWNAVGAFHGQRLDDGDMSFDDFGVLVQGGAFVDDNTELFGRYGHIFPDGNRLSGDDFALVSAGINYYVVPESQALKLTAEVLYYPDDQAASSSLVGPSSSTGLVEDSDGGQLALMLQIQFVF